MPRRTTSGHKRLPQLASQTIFTGDNLDIMRGMDTASIDLIYLDPPFNSNRHYEAPIGSKAAGAEFKDAWTFEDTKDAWWGLIADEHPALYKVIDAAGEVGNKGDKAYLIYMAMRLLEMYRILKDTGSIYLHCDPTMSHSLKMAMDAIFGRKNFRNEIIWHYRRWTAAAKHFQRMHDIILWYSHSDEVTFFPQHEPYSSKTIHRKISVDGETDLEAMRDIGRGVMVSDVWQIPYLHSQAKERVGYPTQKPSMLLDRVIQASSNEGDMLLDPFCGCATACLVAEKLGRRWVGIDVSPLAAQLIRQRMREELGLFGEVFHRTDIPQRSDQVSKPSPDIKHTLFGKQEGKCNGCGHSFPFQNFTRDHMVPTRRGGTDSDENLQLLCGRCNSIKGDHDMSHLIAKIKEDGTIHPSKLKR